MLVSQNTLLLIFKYTPKGKTMNRKLVDNDRKILYSVGAPRDFSMLCIHNNFICSQIKPTEQEQY